MTAEVLALLKLLAVTKYDTNSTTARHPWWLSGHIEPHTEEIELCSMLKGKQLLGCRKWVDKTARRLRNVSLYQRITPLRLTTHPLCKVAGSELALKCKQWFKLYLNFPHEYMHVKHSKPRHNTWEERTQKVYCEDTAINTNIIFKNFRKSLYITQLGQILQNAASFY